MAQVSPATPLGSLEKFASKQSNCTSVCRKRCKRMLPSNDWLVRTRNCTIRTIAIRTSTTRMFSSSSNNASKSFGILVFDCHLLSFENSDEINSSVHRTFTHDANDRSQWNSLRARQQASRHHHIRNSTMKLLASVTRQQMTLG